jgi:hypothetical protein
VPEQKVELVPLQVVVLTSYVGVVVSTSIGIGKFWQMVALGHYYGVPWPLVQGKDLGFPMRMVLSLQHVNQWGGRGA